MMKSILNKTCLLLFCCSTACFAEPTFDGLMVAGLPSPVTQIHQNADEALFSGLRLYLDDFIEVLWGQAEPAQVKCQFAFGYGSIPKKHEAKRAFLFESAAIVSTPDTPVYTVAGPLHPCIGIVLHNTKNDHILIAHKACGTDLQSLIPFIEQLEIKDPQDLKLTLYSSHMLEQDYRDSYHLTACKDHSQKEEHNLTYHFLKKMTGIPASNIKDVLYYSCQELGKPSDDSQSHDHLLLLVDPMGKTSFVRIYPVKIILN